MKHSILFKKTVLSLTIAIITMTPTLTSKSWALDVTRNIPLEVGGYTSTAFPNTFTSTDEVMGILNGKRNLLLHMEAIRRSHSELTPEGKSQLLTKLQPSTVFSSEQTRDWSF